MVSPATRAQLRRVNDPSGVLVLLLLQHPSIATVRVVNDTRDWIIDGDTWVGLPFRFKLPQATGGQAPRAALEVDNVGRALTAELEKLPAGAALQATIRLVSRATPVVVDYEFTAPLSGVSVSVTTVSAAVGNDEALRAPAVKLRYDPTQTPGLFSS